MRRTWRLLVPATIFFVIGITLVIVHGDMWAESRGGLFGKGCYALICQLVATLFILAMTSGDIPEIKHRTADGHGIDYISGLPIDFAGAVRKTYTETFLPTAFLAFGGGLTASAVIIGKSSSSPMISLRVAGFWAIHRSELYVAVILILGAELVIRIGNLAGSAGFVVGFAGGCAWGQIEFQVRTDVASTIAGWTIVGLIVFLACGAREVLVRLRAVKGDGLQAVVGRRSRSS